MQWELLWLLLVIKNDTVCCAGLVCLFMSPVSISAPDGIHVHTVSLCTYCSLHSQHPSSLQFFTNSCLHLRIEPRAQPLCEGPETIKPTARCVLEPWSLTAVLHLEGHKGTQCNWRYPPEETQTVHGEDKPSPSFDCPVRLDPEASFQGLVKAQGTDVGSAPPKHPSM